MTATALPPIVAELLRNNNLLHLATCKDNVPSVSLMNFSFVEATDDVPPLIILASHPETQKSINIRANPQVSVLIHDWTSQTKDAGHGSEESGVAQAATGLSSFLTKLNQSQMSQTSATLDGLARIPTGEEAEYYRAKHLEENPSAECYIKNADILLIVPKKVKIADYDNHVQEYNL